MFHTPFNPIKKSIKGKKSSTFFANVIEND